MPVVTDIKRQKRSELRYNVYLDSKFAFSLTDLELSISGLRVGQGLTETAVSQYRRQAESGKAYALALRYLAIRTRSQQEMHNYLMRKGTSEEDSQLAIQRLREAGLLDDRAFASDWIANRQLLRPRSRRRLEQELRAKGLSGDDIGEALSELDNETELALLVGVAEKKLRLPQYREPEKLIGYLARQGYSYDLIKRALQVISQRSLE